VSSPPKPRLSANGTLFIFGELLCVKCSHQYTLDYEKACEMIIANTHFRLTSNSIRDKAGVAGSKPAQGFAKKSRPEENKTTSNETACFSRAAYALKLCILL